MSKKLLMILNKPEFIKTEKKDNIKLTLESSNSFIIVFAHFLINRQNVSGL